MKVTRESAARMTNREIVSALNNNSRLTQLERCALIIEGAHRLSKKVDED